MLHSESDGSSLRLERYSPPGLSRGRCRSFCFLESEDRRWTVFLVTYEREDGHWRGYFTFRSADYDAGAAELRSADLFVEHSEASVDTRARALGRPLLQALLESAVHTHERRRGASADYGRWFRDLLSRRSNELSGTAVPEVNGPTYEQLRSRYESYRIDQVSHMIALIEPENFRVLCERVLDGREIDFHARDRFQLAMIVVQELERRLPLPPFEVWAEDYVRAPDVYHRYAHDLHNGVL
jgi:hypothetical protein